MKAVQKISGLIPHMHFNVRILNKWEQTSVYIKKVIKHITMSINLLC